MDPAAAPKAPALDPIQLVLGSSGVVLVVLSLLAVASVLVWLVWFLKTAQLGRLRSAERNFELEAETAERAQDLIALAFKHKDAPGARVVMELAKRHHQRGLTSELLSAVAKRALATEQQRITSLMPTLSSIAAFHRLVRHGVGHHAGVLAHRRGKERFATGGGSRHR